jgi:FkbM family methyltransferase
MNEVSNAEDIKVTTVDNFIKEHHLSSIKLLKSDTEGYELEVLKGAADSLKNQLVDMVYMDVGFSEADKQHTYWIEIVKAL